MTTVTLRGMPDGDRAGGGVPLAWATDIWRFLRERIVGLAPDPPAVSVSSQAPSASGLSSSTAVILALFEAFVAATPAAGPIDRSVLIRWAYEFEFAICDGGGMDHLAIALGGATLIQGRPHGLPDVLDHVDFPPEWSLVVVDSGTPKSTPHHIKSVRAQQRAGDRVLAEYVERSDAASVQIWDAIHGRQLTALTTAMSDAHRAMRDLQRMSTPLLERLCSLARDAAGLSLKLSGAGGGGALVGVCRAVDAARIAQDLRAAYRTVGPGVQVIIAGSVPAYS